MKIDDYIACAFCGAKRDEVKKLVAGPKCYICCNCVERANELIKEKPVKVISNIRHVDFKNKKNG